MQNKRSVPIQYILARAFLFYRFRRLSVLLAMGPESSFLLLRSIIRLGTTRAQRSCDVLDGMRAKNFVRDVDLTKWISEFFFFSGIWTRGHLYSKI